MPNSIPLLNEQQQIAILAYRIYEEEGCPNGRAKEHWARAERIIHEQRLGVSSFDDEERSKEIQPCMLSMR